MNDIRNSLGHSPYSIFVSADLDSLAHKKHVPPSWVELAELLLDPLASVRVVN